MIKRVREIFRELGPLWGFLAVVIVALVIVLIGLLWQGLAAWIGRAG